MNARVVSGGELTPEQQRVHRVEHILRRDGGSPGSALEGLAAIIEDSTWTKVPSGPDRPEPFSSFSAFVKARPPFGLGYSVTQLKSLLQLQHPGEGAASIKERMDAMRAEVGRLLMVEIPTASVAGRPEKNVPRSISVGKSDNAAKVVARLKRDAPELAERVVQGEISPNAAAREIGWRKPRILVTSPASVAAALRRHMSPEDLAALIACLLGDTPDH